jgi:hypothetical protein
MSQFGDESRSRLVQGAFDDWFRALPKSLSSPEYHPWFKLFRYGFMDGELALGCDREDPAYVAGWTAGRNSDGRR